MVGIKMLKLDSSVTKQRKKLHALNVFVIFGINIRKSASSFWWNIKNF